VARDKFGGPTVYQKGMGRAWPVRVVPHGLGEAKEKSTLGPLFFTKN